MSLCYLKQQRTVPKISQIRVILRDKVRWADNIKENMLLPIPQTLTRPWVQFFSLQTYGLCLGRNSKDNIGKRVSTITFLSALSFLLLHCTHPHHGFRYCVCTGDSQISIFVCVRSRLLIAGNRNLTQIYFRIQGDSLSSFM